MSAGTKNSGERWPTALATGALRAIDARASAELGLSGCVLMENAGRSAAHGLLAVLAPEVRIALDAAPAVILCGPGNNGGDGYVIARHLAINGVQAVTWSVTAFDRLAPDAKVNANANRELGLRQRWLSPELCQQPSLDLLAELAAAPVLIDALLGTGQTGALREPYASLVARANQLRTFRVAVDLPTGLDADSGQTGSVCFQAAWTATFAAPKLGFQHPQAQAVLGKLAVFDIGLPKSFIERVAADWAAAAGS